MANIFRRIGGAIKKKFTPKSRPITEPRRRPVPQVRSVQIKPVQRMSVADMTKRMAKDVGGTAYTQKRNTSTPLATGRATQQRRTSVLATPIKTTQPQPIIIRRSPDKFIQEAILPRKIQEAIVQQERKARDSRWVSTPGRGWRDDKGNVYQGASPALKRYWDENSLKILQEKKVPIVIGKADRFKKAAGLYSIRRGEIVMPLESAKSSPHFSGVVLHEFGHSQTINKPGSKEFQMNVYERNREGTPHIVGNSLKSEAFNIGPKASSSEIAATLYRTAVEPASSNNPYKMRYTDKDKVWIENKVYSDIGLKPVSIGPDYSVKPASLLRSPVQERLVSDRAKKVNQVGIDKFMQGSSGMMIERIQRSRVDAARKKRAQDWERRQRVGTSTSVLGKNIKNKIW